MAKKGNVLKDSFERILELGGSTAKKAGKSVVQTFSPLRLLEQMISSPTNQEQKHQEINEKIKKTSATSLNFNKLHRRYQEQDEAKADSLKKRFFQRIKRGEEALLDEEERKKIEKKRREAYEEREKEKKRKEKQQDGEIPIGKQRRSIFSPKKMAKRNMTEVKPSAGKN